MKNQLKKGFTLIELLIVIAIIGILAGIVIASLGGSIDKAGDGALKGSLSALKTDAVVAIESDNSTIDICGTFGTPSAGLYSNLTPKYIDAEYVKSGCVQATDSVTTKKHAVNWAVVVELKADSNTAGEKNYYCIDGSGAAKLKSNTTATVTTTAADGDIGDGSTAGLFADNYKCQN